MDEAKLEMETSVQQLREAYANITKFVGSATTDAETLQDQRDIYKAQFEETEEAFHKYLSELAKDGNSSEHAKVHKDRIGHRNDHIVMKNKVQRAIVRVSPAASAGGPPPPVPLGTPAPAPVVNVKAPEKKELTMFNGDVRLWLAFWASFERFHKDASLDEIEKFLKLRASMTSGSEADKLVQSYPVTPGNYQKALDSLKERYGRNNVLVKVYVRELLNLMVSKVMGHKTNFVDVVTQLSSQVRNLDTLGMTRDKCADVLYPVVESCLPEETMTAWQRSGEPEDLDSILNFLQTEVNRQTERKLAREQFGSVSTAASTSKGGTSHPSKKPSTTTGKTTSFSTSSTNACVFCDHKHPSHECKKARKMPMEKRREILLGKSSCWRCLIPGHMARHCSEEIFCDSCKKRHYTFMCPDSQQNWAGASGSSHKKDSDRKVVSFKGVKKEEEQPPSVSIDMKNTVQSTLVPLQTLWTYAFGRNGTMKRVRLVFDSCCQHSYVLEPIAKELDMEKVGEETVIHDLFGGIQSSPQHHNIVRIYLGNKDGSNNANFEIRTTNEVSANIISPPSGPWIQEYAKKGVVFSDFGSSKTSVDILVGNDVRPRCFKNNTVTLHDGPGPVAEETIWGWVLGGKLPAVRDRSASTMLVTNMHVADRPVSDLWALESIGICDSAEKESRELMDQQVIAHFKETVKRDKEGRYEVSLPWLAGMKQRLPNNYFACVRRLRTTTKKLWDTGYYHKYDALFKQWEKDNMIELVPAEDEPHLSKAQYLPHRAVVKLSSSTTPVRPVFDASAKLKGHPSLNECLDKGTNTLELIPAILTRFRLYRIGVIADIRKAFQQISVNLEDRDFIRFIWWEDEKCQKLKIFRHSRVPFGVSSSPFLLGITLQHHLNDECPTTPFTHTLLQNMYVDNTVASLPSMKEAREFQQQSQELLLPAQFDLRGWEFGPDGQDRDLSVLGLQWNTMRDTLRIDTAAAEEKLSENVVTQRGLLALAHSLFDPLGIISPFSLQAKLLLRQCHEAKLGWDTPLPVELDKEFHKWVKQIPVITGVEIPRHSYFGKSSNVSLHLFCDASGSAYAATAFLRVELPHDVKLTLLQARSKVAPKTKATIPRLELISCTIGARLYQTVLEDIGGRDIPTTFWTDSTTALAWINGDGPWGVFVGNRKAEINKLTDVNSWRHVPGKHNPADLPSRGCSAAKLIESRWWEGPEWLRQPPADWPSSHEEADLSTIESERRKTVTSNLNMSETNPFLGLLRVSSYPKIVRILTNVVHFKRNLIRRVPPVAAATMAIPEDEKMEAEYALIRLIQQQLPLQENHLKRLRPFYDEYGIVRTQTRLLHDDEADFKKPIILPNGNEFVTMLIRWEHDNHCHIGTELLLAHLRQNFWIVHGRREVRKVVHGCWICKRFLSRPMQVPEAPLPAARTNLGRPFETTGVDAAGPITLKNKQKVWILLFTCAVYRGVHLEVVDAMSTDAFLRAFRHFVARRGRPQIIYSDNGLNFVGARRIMANLDWSKVKEYADLHRMDWRLNVATAPWWGGFFERMIGLVKGLLLKMLGRKVVHHHELLTLCIEAEEAVNNRPLTYISEDPEDPQPLTPNHFLRNSEILPSVPEADVIEGRHLRAAFRKLQHLREALRSRFRTEYIGQLRGHRDSMKEDMLQIGDVVIIQEDNKKRQDWPLGVVVCPIPSKKDGVARAFKLKTKGGEIERPAQRLFPMEVAAEESTLWRNLDEEEGQPSTARAQST